MASPHAPHTARVREMYALYEVGATLEEIGADYGITRERVRQLFNKAGLPTRSPQETLELHRTPAPPVADMHALYEQGATLEEVGKQFGLSASHIGELFKRAGLKTRGPGKRVGVKSRAAG